MGSGAIDVKSSDEDDPSPWRSLQKLIMGGKSANVETSGDHDSVGHRSVTSSKGYGTIRIKSRNGSIGKQKQQLASRKRAVIKNDDGSVESDDEITTDSRLPSVHMGDPKPHVPGQNACLWLFHLLQGMATVSSAALLVTQVVPFFVVPSDHIIESVGLFSLVLKVYIASFCAIFIVIETGLPVPFLK
jgi:hypothetical protein